jgi:hypothetical protein
MCMCAEVYEFIQYQSLTHSHTYTYRGPAVRGGRIHTDMRECREDVQLGQDVVEALEHGHVASHHTHHLWLSVCVCERESVCVCV